MQVVRPPRISTARIACSQRPAPSLHHTRPSPLPKHIAIPAAPLLAHGITMRNVLCHSIVVGCYHQAGPSIFPHGDTIRHLGGPVVRVQAPRYECRNDRSTVWHRGGTKGAQSKSGLPACPTYALHMTRTNVSAVGELLNDILARYQTAIVEVSHISSTAQRHKPR
ncbi:uncharacterized protein B0H18DRAFT_513637 [Fomitopsis serialis]|uniref:uncharacterized protein n=1 Tax=Fomitopsis serialis TaxID=139415 RepID=UPI0020085615|nr:uncharacterized protein B0H18DRAFT_513637 [Neoantrodia serialis]KAH9922500.1 hypothetical protein B0H18DRAFT_513637 [Neoantrodia serialis]